MSPLPTPAPGGPRIAPGGVVPRLVVVLGAVLVVLAAGRVDVIPFVALAVGVVLAVVRPDTMGAWVALPAAAWLFVAATGADVTSGPMLLAATGGYLVHTGTAAAAVFGWSARVPGAVARRWLLRCLPAVVLTVALTGVDAVVGGTPRSPLFAVVAAGAAVVAAGLLFRLLTDVRAGDR